MPRGFPASFKEGIIAARRNKWPHYEEDLVVSGSALQNEVIASSGWSSKQILEEFISNNFLPVTDSKGQLASFELSQTGAIEAVKKRDSNQSHVISVIREMGSTQQASQQLSEIGIEFDYPKPVSLVAYLISMVRDKSALVMDFFTGSGTTGHAVLQLNKEDGGDRRFILVEMEQKISREITAERLKRVIHGYGDTPGFGGGFLHLKYVNHHTQVADFCPPHVIYYGTVRDFDLSVRVKAQHAAKLHN